MNTQDRADLREKINECAGIAWDTCHKIYILMDEEQVTKTEELGYKALVRVQHSTRNLMYSTVLAWYRNSCPLRFIDAVTTVDGNPNDGFETIVAQR